MLSKIYKLSKLIAKGKIYVVRSSTYLNIINFILIMATFKQTYKLNISNFILVPIGLFVGLFIGYLDYKLILRHETMLNNKKNDVKDQIDRIEKEIKLLSKKIN